VQIIGTHHVAITTGRFARLRAFYVETLGLPVVGCILGQEIVFIGAGSTAIELIGVDHPDSTNAHGTGADRPTRQGWHHLAWEVADVDAVYAELTARGVPTHSPPEDFPPDTPLMRIAFLRDPDGNLLELIQPLHERDPALPAPT
jgi:glyoxylase I family protein